MHNMTKFFNALKITPYTYSHEVDGFNCNFYMRFLFTFRIICHIRPELSFLNANISVLNFGKFLRELPDSVINLSYLNLETIELYVSSGDNFGRYFYEV